MAHIGPNNPRLASVREGVLPFLPLVLLNRLSLTLPLEVASVSRRRRTGKQRDTRDGGSKKSTTGGKEGRLRR